MNQRICWLLVFGLWIGPRVGMAAEEGLPPVRDFGSGFEKLRSLGLPDAEGAQWVRLTAPPASAIRLYGSGDSVILQGNAWLLGTEEGGWGRFVINGTAVRRLRDEAALQAAVQEEWERQAAQPDTDGAAAAGELATLHMSAGTWVPADLAADLRDAETWLAGGGDEDDDMAGLYRSFGASDTSLFLLAAHAYRVGETDPANRIVARLLERAGDPQQVILGAVHAVGDQAYHDAWQAFAESGDWAAYAEALRVLPRTFGAGWPTARLLERILEQIQPRLGEAIAMPTGAEALPQPQQELIRALFNAPGLDSLAHLEGTGFIYGDLAASLRRGRESVDHPLVRLLSEGRMAVPVLVALLDCDVPVRFGVNPNMMFGLGGWNVGRFSGVDLDLLDDDMILDGLFSAYPRPQLLSEIAASLLGSLLPARGDEYFDAEELDPDELRRRISAWLEEVATLEPGELALHYLEHGTDMQRQDAAQRLAKAEDPVLTRALEQHLLAQVSDYELWEVAYEYALGRETNAAAFVEAYTAALERLTGAAPVEPTESDEDGMFVGGADATLEDWELEGSSDVIKLMRMAVRPLSFDEYLREVAADAAPLWESGQLLVRHLNRRTTAEAMEAILRVAAEMEASADRARVIQVLYFLTDEYSAYLEQLSGSASGFGAQAEDGRDGDDELPAPSSQASRWRELLGDDRPFEGEDDAQTVGGAAAWAMAALYEDQGVIDLRPLYEAVGPDLNALLIRRAGERLEGKTGAQLSVLPSESEVSEERRQAMLETLESAAPEALMDWTKSLTASERLVLSAMVKDNRALHERLAPFAARIVESTCAWEDPEETAFFQELVGQPFSVEIFSNLVDRCKARVRQGQSPIISIDRLDHLAGFRIAAKTSLPHGDDAWGTWSGYVEQMRALSQSPAMVVAIGVLAGNQQIFAAWPVDVPRPEPEDPGDGNASDLLVTTGWSQGSGMEAYFDQISEEFAKLLAGWM